MAKLKNKNTEIETTVPVKKGIGYTYVGAGEDSPRVINFMGLQKFVRGQITEVTSPAVLAKIAINPSFVEGEIEAEELHEYDEEAKTEADAKRKKDAELNAAYLKKYGK